HPYVRSFEDGVLHGQQVLRLLLDLKAKGYRPDVVVAHPGWGESLYVREAFPSARLIHFCEYYYRAQGADAGFDPEFPLDTHGAASIRSRNALHLLNLENCDLAITPTRWQRSLHPAAYRDGMRVIHEGIDTAGLGPDPEATLALPDGQVLRAGQPILTYVARNLEPYRGLHSFMRALPRILAAHPGCQVVVVGGDEVSYGSRPKDAANWRSKLLAENPIDPARVHFLGKVPYATYKQVLQVSAVHLYLTYPFVLSWSLLEAMASGCLVVASDTAPVREVIEDGRNGRLVDFFDTGAIAERVVQALSKPERFQALRQQARATAAGYSTQAGIAGYLEALGLTSAVVGA
ncbi:glycosyltransferase family 4 protein, partial [Pseudomonas otitidis]